jgi:hypothetical protein
MKLNLNGLSPRHYAFLIMRDELGLTFGQIGIRTGKNYAAARQLYLRAKEKQLILDQMRLIKDKVISLLTADAKYREDDNKLIARIWYQESLLLNCNTSVDLLTALAKGKLSSAESIRRSRQKVQEEMPELRGRNYKERQEESGQVKKDLGYGKNT